MSTLHEPITDAEKKQIISQMKPHSITRKGKTTFIPCDATSKEVAEALKVVVFNKEIEVEQGSGNQKVTKKIKPNLIKFKAKIDEFFTCADLDDVESVILYFERLANSEELKAKRVGVLEVLLKKFDDQTTNIRNRIAGIKGDKAVSVRTPNGSRSQGAPSREEMVALIKDGLDTPSKLATHYGVTKESIHRWANKVHHIEKTGDRNRMRYVTDAGLAKRQVSTQTYAVQELATGSMLSAGLRLVKELAEEETV